MAPGAEYGALHLDEKDMEENGRRSVVSSGTALALGLGVLSLVAFLYGSSAGATSAAPAATVAVAAGKLIGDEMNDLGRPDCICNGGCYPVGKKDGSGNELFGECPVQAPPYDYHGMDAPTCIGVDWTENYESNGAWFTHCQIGEGKNSCGAFPCRNGGFCADGVDDYTCDCTWGWEGILCNTPLNQCAVREETVGFPGVPDGKFPVCDDNAECEDRDGLLGYMCTCIDGFMGDGYARDQTTVAFGSVLHADKLDDSNTMAKGWLNRDTDATWFEADGTTPTAAVDANHDGHIDMHGCTDINDCASNPCIHGQCYDLWDGAFVGEDGTYGQNPDYKLDQTNAFVCVCGEEEPEERWGGDFCEIDIDECDGGEHNCDPNAFCTNTLGSFTCTCNNFWQGDGYRLTTDKPTIADWASPHEYIGCIDIDDCTIVTEKEGGGMEVSSPCENGGTCHQVDGTGDFECTCVAGWEAKTCSLDIDECERYPGMNSCHTQAHCHNVPGSWHCLCNNGWTGDGDMECWDADDCEFSPCLHGGTCEDCGTLCLICDCIIGWRGRTCEVDWDECKMGIHTCHDFAICANIPGSFDCACEPGYSGDGYQMCNEVDDCDRWEDDPERDDNQLVDYAMKVYDKAGNLVEKEGLVSYAPWADDLKITVPSSDGFTQDAAGALLATVHQCGEWEPATRTWAPHGECADTGAASFVCQCDVGWSDSNCDLDVDECARATDSCHKYAVCMNLPGSFVCQCKEGYTGDGVVSCTDIDDCSIGAKCFAGKCVDLGPSDFRCVCNQGYEDRLCDLDINECAAFTHNCTPYDPKTGTERALCKNTPGSFKCKCRPGFAGDGIGPEGCDDIDDCGSAPCENGTCQDLGVQTYGCTCDYGWKDTNCDHDVNECIDGAHDCHPEGKCVNTPGGFYCRCVSGHTGDGYTCTDLDDCDPDPCDEVHGTCHDGGANKYHCTCEAGFGGMGCESDEVECMIGTHECHPNADCFNTYGSYICACKKEFYGDGQVCAPCTDCKAVCGSDEDTDPTGYACGHGPGYERDTKRPPCAAVDRTCINVNECGPPSIDNCDPYNADCTDNEGSYICECRVLDEWWGEGTEGTCSKCTICTLGQHMLDDCTTTTDRKCAHNIPDGNYAIETYSGSTGQCLVHWGGAGNEGKVFPERYNWGGRLGSPGIGMGTQSVGKYEMWGGGEDGMDAKDQIPPPDVCDDGQHPICGVCDYSDRSPGQNIVDGMEAVWTFVNLDLDLYLILNAADGQGFRCLGFQSPDAPYPQNLAWVAEAVQAAEGLCHTAEDMPPMVAGKEMKIACGEDSDCAAEMHCFRPMSETGSWSTSKQGPSTMAGITQCKAREAGTMRETEATRDDCELIYFCGFENSEFGSARDKLMANLATVWNVAPLACEGKYCQHQWTQDSYMIRSLATGDTNDDGIMDQKDYRCLYFPDQVGSIPEMVPAAPTADGVWLGIGGDADADGDGDPNCGIALMGDGAAAQSARLGVEHTDDMQETQERELLLNHQAVWRLIKLPSY